jgi:5,10-methylenetetrahydromethanopterin reductase
MNLSLSGTPLIWQVDHDRLREHAQAAQGDGFHRYHLAEAPTGGLDVLTELLVLGLQVPELEVASAVVPTWPRNPMVLAAQAITVQNALEGRLTLGIGLSHAPMMKEMGIGFERPVRHLAEYLEILVPLLSGEDVDHQGELFSLKTALVNQPNHPTEILVAALGEQTLRVAGARTAGTTLTWVGPRTIQDHVVPVITAAADKAGRPAPQIVASLPICVTDDVDAVRAKASDEWGYSRMPSYIAMFEREGVDGAGDLAIIGNEDYVSTRLAEFTEIGVTEFVPKEYTPLPGDDGRTRAFLASVVNSFE